jgi:DNA-binding transcriptional LysR family regulator
MDRLRAMQTFVRIVDEGSLTAAARALDSSLPAVVRTLAALEGNLGVRILNRTTRRISLTDEGRRYLDSCRQVLAAVESAEAAVTEQAAEPSGRLAITAPVLFGQMYVAPAVTRFVRQYDKLHVSVMLADRVVNLLEEGIDAGIRIGRLDDSSLVAQTVGSVRRVIVASPSYLRRNGTPRHPDDLLKANCVRFSGGATAGWSFQEGRKRFTVPVTGNLEFNHVAPTADACAAGLGFGSFISYQVAPYIARDRLRIVLERFEPPPRPISVIYPHARLMPARTKAFVAWMKRELKGVNLGN